MGYQATDGVLAVPVCPDVEVSEPPVGSRLARDRGAARFDGEAPQGVSRGVQLHGVRVEAGIHWARLMGLEQDIKAGRSVLVREFGEPELGNGGQHYADRWQFECGIGLRFNPRGSVTSDHCQIDIPGSVFDAIGSKEGMALLEVLGQNGFRRATRLDVYLDFIGEDVGLINAVNESRRRGEVCHTRTGRCIEDSMGDKVNGRMVTLGRRGKDGSGRFLRVYDKGLESGERKAGMHERCELEAHGDVATMVLVMLRESEKPEDWNRMQCMERVEQLEGFERQIASIVLGAFDFREKNGQRSLKRRPRVQWFVDLVGAVELCRLVRGVRKATSFASVKRWMCQSVAPVLKAFMCKTGRPLEVVMLDMIREWESVKASFGPACFEYERVCVGGPSPGGNGYQGVGLRAILERMGGVYA